MTSLPLSIALGARTEATAEVLRSAHDLLHRSSSLLTPAVGLGVALLVAARGNPEALDGAALALACVIGAEAVSQGLGMRSLDRALASWLREHGEQALTQGAALSFFVQALALL
ncbi:MAG: hypothetical protein EOO75_18855 [Myxococcales bacterium]|nr:MAG: hypothetical protein EOO75_18855 [Myxococcales bacterium]